MAREIEYDFDGNAVRKTEKQLGEKRIKRERRRQDKIIKLEESELRKAKRKSTKLSRVASTIIVSTLVFSLLAIMIQGQVKMTELAYGITEAEKQLSELEGTEVQLQMQAAGTMDEDEIESYATGTLGMEKVNQSQITYINISGENQGTVYKEENNSLFENILEFFGFGKE